MKEIHVCLSLVLFTLASLGRLRVAASSFTSDGLELTLLSPQPGQRWSGEPVQVHVDVDLGVGVTADRIRGNPASFYLCSSGCLHRSSSSSWGDGAGGGSVSPSCKNVVRGANVKRVHYAEGGTAKDAELDLVHVCRLKVGSALGSVSVWLEEVGEA